MKNEESVIMPKNIEGKIEFKDVSFRYREAKEVALDKVSFKISAGTTVALVGPSGGGKTTVARLLYRYFMIRSGYNGLRSRYKVILILTPTAASWRLCRRKWKYSM